MYNKRGYSLYKTLHVAENTSIQELLKTDPACYNWNERFAHHVLTDAVRRQKYEEYGLSGIQDFFYVILNPIKGRCVNKDDLTIFAPDVVLFVPLKDAYDGKVVNIDYKWLECRNLGIDKENSSKYFSQTFALKLKMVDTYIHKLEHEEDVKVFIIVQFIEHPVFDLIDRYDLQINVRLGLKEALCGFIFNFQHLNNKMIEVASVPGKVYKDGRTCAPGMGMPYNKDDHGKLFFKVTVVFPETISSDIVDTLEKILPDYSSVVPPPNKRVKKEVQQMPINKNSESKWYLYNDCDYVVYSDEDGTYDKPYILGECFSKDEQEGAAYDVEEVDNDTSGGGRNNDNNDGANNNADDDGGNNGEQDADARNMEKYFCSSDEEAAIHEMKKNDDDIGVVVGGGGGGGNCVVDDAGQEMSIFYDTIRPYNNVGPIKELMALINADDFDDDFKVPVDLGIGEMVYNNNDYDDAAADLFENISNCDYENHSTQYSTKKSMTIFYGALNDLINNMM